MTRQGPTKPRLSAITISAIRHARARRWDRFSIDGHRKDIPPISLPKLKCLEEKEDEGE